MTGNTADSNSDGIGNGGGVYSGAGTTANLANTVVALNSDLGGGERAGHRGKHRIRRVQSHRQCRDNQFRGEHDGRPLRRPERDDHAEPRRDRERDGDQTRCSGPCSTTAATGRRTCRCRAAFWSTTRTRRRTVTMDQRAIARPQGAGFDIGAVEVAPCVTDPVVTTDLDMAPGSLREAIVLACPGSVITFDPAVTAGGATTITLTGGELLIDKDLTISRAGARPAGGERGERDPCVRRCAGTPRRDFHDLTIAQGDTPGNGARACLIRRQPCLSDGLRCWIPARRSRGGGLYSTGGSVLAIEQTSRRTVPATRRGRGRIR